MPSSYTLGDHYEEFVRRLVGSGRYSSASEVVRDSLRLLEEREETRQAKLAALREVVRVVEVERLRRGRRVPHEIRHRGRVDLLLHEPLVDGGELADRIADVPFE